MICDGNYTRLPACASKVCGQWRAEARNRKAAKDRTEKSPINENGRCKVHPIILIKRRRRNGEWSQILKECPLCRADDDESVWSASCSSSSRTSRSSDAQQQQHHRKWPPSPPQVSAFKESKEDEPSPESRINYQFR